MTTAYELFFETVKLLTYVRQSTATGVGGTTTTVDSTRNERDDAWNDGIIWKPAASECRRITDWVQSTHTFTHAAFTAGVGNTNPYYVSDKEFPKDVLVMAVNDAFTDPRNHLATYNTSLTTVADQREYTVPAGIREVLRLWIARRTTEPYDFAEWYSGWKTVGNTLEFTRLPEAGYIIRLGYNGPHAALDPVSATLDATVIDDRLPPERIKWIAAEYALRRKIKRTEGAKSIFAQSMEDARAEAAKTPRPPQFQKVVKVRL